MQVEVSAHVDAAEAAAGKVRLSKARAEAVVAFLRLNGIPAEAITTRWFDATRPLVQTTRAEQQNRIVQLFLK